MTRSRYRTAARTDGVRGAAEHAADRAAAGFPAQPPATLRDVVSILRRRRRAVALTALAALGGAATLLGLAEPRYVATAQVIVDARQTQVVDVEAVLAGLPAEDSAVRGEAAVVRSPELVSSLIRKLGLDEDPEFNIAMRAPPWLAPAAMAAALPKSAQAALGLDADGFADLDQIGLEEKRAVLGAVRRRLDVAQGDSALVLEVSFESDDPVKAALIANAAADEYIRRQLEAKRAATRSATRWLEEKANALRADVEAAEAEVEAYKTRLTREGQGPEILSQQLAELNSRLVAARAQRAEAEARHERVADIVRRAGRVAAAGEVVANPLIQKLREQEAEVVRREAELSSRYLDRHPALIDVRAELRDLRGAIADEVSKIVESLRNEAEVARVRERSLADSVEMLERRVRAQAEATVDLRQLQRAAEASRALYETFLGRHKETLSQEDVQSADARVAARAEPPSEPEWPRPKAILGFAGFGGLALGSMLALALEALDGRVRSAGRLEDETGLPVLAKLPLAPGGRDPLAHVRARPAGRLAEAARDLRSALLLGADPRPKVVAVTSAAPGEGKSTTAALLALAAAGLGRPTLLIDCDLRMPAQARLFEAAGGPDVAAVLAGEAAFEEAAHVDLATGLHVLPAQEIRGTSPRNAADLLAGPGFAALLAELGGRYELIVLDTPPVLAVTDARVAALRADAVVFAARWNASRSDAVTEALDRLEDVGAPVAGLALTAVEPDEEARISYGGRRSHYGRFAEYYEG